MFPLADILHDRGVPLLFLTGYGRDMLPQRHAASEVLLKPFDPKQLLHAVASITRLAG